MTSLSKANQKIKISIGKCESIIQEGDSNIIKLSTKQFIEWFSSIKKPLIQTFLNEDKVNDLYTSLNDNYDKVHHSLSCRLITIAHIIIGDEEEYYLVDGQHRVNATIKLYNESNEEINKSFLASIIRVSNEEEMNQLFVSINQDSSKNPVPKLGIFKFAAIKKYFKDTCSFLPERITNNVYTVDEIMTVLTQTEIYNKNDNITQICELFKKKEKKFFKEVGYKEIITKQKSKFANNEIKCIDNNCCMFLKRSNFFTWLNDSEIKPEHNLNQKISTSKKLEIQVWDKEFGAKTSSHCPMVGCKNIIEMKKTDNWCCGRLTSCKNGGDTSLSNLRPLCKPCYDMMDDNNWDDYEKFKSNQYIIDEYFEDSSEIQCLSKNSCNNNITPDNFSVWCYKTKKGTDKIKPVCEECYNNSLI